MRWHPLFAKMLRPIVQEHYEVETNVPVGDAPRAADILLVRRTAAVSRTAASPHDLEYPGVQRPQRLGTHPRS
jgi:hypothetical protein